MIDHYPDEEGASPHELSPEAQEAAKAALSRVALGVELEASLAASGNEEPTSEDAARLEGSMQALRAVKEELGLDD